jgi:hypothetical protein
VYFRKFAGEVVLAIDDNATSWPGSTSAQFHPTPMTSSRAHDRVAEWAEDDETTEKYWNYISFLNRIRPTSRLMVASGTAENGSLRSFFPSRS